MKYWKPGKRICKLRRKPTKGAFGGRKAMLKNLPERYQKLERELSSK
jgi:hypothetical protein